MLVHSRVGIPDKFNKTLFPLLIPYAIHFKTEEEISFQ